jgi:hypothetical protein
MKNCNETNAFLEKLQEKCKGVWKGDIRKNNRGAEYGQSILYTYRVISRWNPTLYNYCALIKCERR